MGLFGLRLFLAVFLGSLIIFGLNGGRPLTKISDPFVICLWSVLVLAIYGLLGLALIAKESLASREPIHPGRFGPERTHPPPESDANSAFRREAHKAVGLNDASAEAERQLVEDYFGYSR